MKHYLPSAAAQTREARDPAQNPLPWDETRVVGRRLPRVDAYERVSGSAVFTLDVTLPDMLHAVIVRCPHAHARVLRVDTGPAEVLPGVRAVITSSSPGTGIPWYVGDRGPTSQLFDNTCRYAGEEVAAVAADTLHQAWDAARAITVEYETLPFVIDPERAVEEDAPPVHDGGNRAGSGSYERGDVDVAFAETDVVLEETYRTSCQIHTPLETFASVARWDGNHLIVWDSTQSVFDRQQDLARIFHLPLSSVRVVCSYMGGGFGAKLDTGKYTVIAALLARKTGRPVKMALTREESFLSEGNRPANVIKLKGGVNQDGRLMALEGEFLGEIGAYPGGGVSPYLVHNLYLCPNVRTRWRDVLTNAGKQRAMRAPGEPQCAWALEQLMDALAIEIGMDPIEFRLQNFASVQQTTGYAPYTSAGLPFTSNGLRECLTEGASEFDWSAARQEPRSNGHLRRGVGVAAGMWRWIGNPSSTTIVRLFADGSINLNMGASDIGTGTKTVMAMVVAEELGVPVERIRIEHADTGTTQFAPASGGSQTVVSNAPAVRAAALDVKRQILEAAALQFDRPASELVLENSSVFPAGEPERAMPLGEVPGVQQQQVLVGIGRRHAHPEGKVPLPFAAHFAEVEVNTRTGEIRVLRITAAHDSGRVMNGLTYQNQVFGGVTMGIGFGLTERRILDRQTGKMVNANWHDYKIPTSMDVPLDMSCVPIDLHDTECNSTGAKGIGEPATIPTAAAIANAVYHAIGVRMTSSPITPEQVLQRLTESHRGQ